MTMFFATFYSKKIIYILFLFFFIHTINASLDNAYSIVFIHIGDQLPAYLYDAVQQARLFNPGANIIIVAHQKALDKLDQKFSTQQALCCIECESLQPSPEHIKFKKDTKLNASSRDGFWLKSTERFFYLDELMTTYQLNNVFHMEYDNMLYATLAELLPLFHQHYPNIGATFDNDERCIAGFIYFANQDGINNLVTYIAQLASQGLNDMEIIARYKKSHPDKVVNLPIIMPKYLENYPLKSTMGHVPSSAQDYISYINKFNSIFDAAALGQYLGGIDPRNGPSKPGFINERCLFNPSLLTYEWHKDEHGRKAPYAVLQGEKWRINNLHVHSKNLSSFAS